MSKTRKFFGTDGIRGEANRPPMTADMALKVAMATALTLRRGAEEETDPSLRPHQSRAVIGKDTRLSGYMLEQAMASGFVAMGMDVVLVGPIPTPGIAMLTRSLRADVGVMISASHNPFQDNGIKLFASDGYKLPDEVEQVIEERMSNGACTAALAAPADLGKASRLDDASGRYIEFIKASFSRRQTLERMKIVVDCANGSAYKVAPKVLWELGAEVVETGVSPNGRNINDGCGATDTQRLQEKVVECGADLGVALDGDADRLILVDETGSRIDGDQIMALIAKSWHARGILQCGGIVTTVMSNLGLERFVRSLGLDLVRTPVGDRYVVEEMRRSGYNFGGEQSGHLIMTDYGTTGDGLLAALQVLDILRQDDRPASEVLHVFDPLPQILKNVRYKNGKPLEKEAVKAAILRAEKDLSGGGRLLVRASGTEPVIRVMAEGDKPERIEKIVDGVCAAITQAAG